jgi:heme exporter protein A
VVSVPAPPASGLVVQGLSRRFGPRWVLARVGFEVRAGAGLLLLGHNGSGKTTLLRCLASALKPHDGTATFEGLRVWDDRRTLRSRIALLSHDSHLYDDLSARENLRAWARMGGYTADLDALLARVGLSDTGHRPARAFSAGMKRRLALARVLLKQPALVLLDEPFTSLDAAGRALMGEIVGELRARGITLVLSTHLPELGARYCDDALRLEAGRVVWRGTAAEAPAQMRGEA